MGFWPSILGGYEDRLRDRFGRYRDLVACGSHAVAVWAGGHLGGRVAASAMEIVADTPIKLAELENAALVGVAAWCEEKDA